MGSVTNEPAPPDTSQADEGPPPYNPARVGSVAKRVDIRDVQLVHAHFEREDDDAIPHDSLTRRVAEPEVMVELEHATSPDGLQLHYLVRFGTVADESPSFRVYAFFRLSYELEEGDPLTDEQLEQFGYWNVVFNAWPYFREYVSSTANRAGLPRLTLPVMRVPRTS